ncbi:iron-siderophore ABC transporter substrate-binding protein [Microbacterium flavum]|uniref:Iron-siderophore ABC transporter substrate-binding protein n=1 Tax=Microbacterium flavum TaxID=415216 RepID=A0ABS5XVH3_9MICO|nr:iron-siderophore ABC transporter substrate-binding protein [Microbacterium flavum]MBT8798520.1 iron-siderophore ABC transporter substrate-binding protein [Microbacterium flavum]
MRRLREVLSLAAITGAAALLLSGCAGTGAPATSDAATGGEGAFPITIDSALGTTTIEKKPERIATWGWGATDAVLALGIQPVAIPADDYSGGDDKMPPWISDAVDSLGGEKPVILDSSAAEIPIEALLKTNPDVLLAPYSGLTQKEYDAVTAAGVPVVAYPDGPWTTPWRDVIDITGTALGLSGEADALVADLDGQVKDAAAAHPEFAGKTIAYVDDDVDTFYLYLPSDPRVAILEDLGFSSPPSVTALDTGEGTFYTTVSYENLDKIDAQVLFTQAEDQKTLDEFLASDRGALIPAVKKGAVAAMVGAENASAMSPTALTLPWVLPTLTEKLAAAVAKS